MARKYASIPGVVVDDDPRLEKESEPGCKSELGCKVEKSKKRRRRKPEPLTEDELNQIGVDSGLCD